jgi:glycolate oxidase iron-sulfur subunit
MAQGRGAAQPLEHDLLSEYDNMLSCVRCGLCLTSCPTYVLSGHEAEGPRGRVAMARALTEGRLELTPDLIEHERNCLVCEACTAVCPAGVRMGPIQIALRSALASSDRPSPRARLARHVAYRRAFADMATLRRLTSLLRVSQRLGLVWLARRSGLLPLVGMKDGAALLPSIPDRFVTPKGEVYPAQSRAAAPRVSFFAGCIMSTAFAELDHATIRLLQRSGCDVSNTAGQGCCGALHAHSGEVDMARALAKQNIAAFELDGDAPIVVNSAGCGAMLKEYGHLLYDEPEWEGRAKALVARVRDLSEFLARRELPLRRPVNAVVTYQEPCHLAHAQRISRQPRELLQRIRGLELREMKESALCCGSAGVYNLTNPAESRRLRDRKVANAIATGASVIVTANPGCLLQLRAGLAAEAGDVTVKHIVELLDEATAP